MTNSRLASQSITGQRSYEIVHSWSATITTESGVA